MRRNYYAPVRCRPDGSIYTDRYYRGRETATSAFFVFGASVVFAAIVVFALAGPHKTQAEQNTDIASPMRVDNEPVEDLPSIYPVQGRLTSRFGSRRNPFGGQPQFHAGQDIAAPAGTPVIAPADGVVTFAGLKTGYGKFVIVRHANGIITCYAHLSSYGVIADQTVKRNDEIGHVGSTGRSTGPHLHYEVRVGDQKVDPMDYLPQ